MTAPWNGRPPAPLDERDGRHEIVIWDADAGPVAHYYDWSVAGQRWHIMEEGGGLLEDEIDLSDAEYGAAVLTPDQIAAQIAEAVKAERDVIVRGGEVRASGYRKIKNEQCAAAVEWYALAIRSRGETK